MKLATAAGVVLASAGFTHAANGDHCRAKNPDVNKAIAEFCSRKNLVVPSDWSTKGKYSVYTRVSIDGEYLSMVVRIPSSSYYTTIHDLPCTDLLRSKLQSTSMGAAKLLQHPDVDRLRPISQRHRLQLEAVRTQQVSEMEN
jgi:hypothetical protein